MREDIFEFNEWGSWGVTDDRFCLYDKGVALEEALKSGEEFDTGWHGFKKELEDMRVKRTNSAIIVSVHAEMDEGEDLVFDCLNEEEYEKVTDEKLNSILEGLAMEMEFCECAEDSISLPLTATVDDILKKATECMRVVQEKLRGSFRLCMEMTLSEIYDLPYDDEFIQKRVAEIE